MVANDNTEALTITANDNLTISGAIGGIANKQLSTLDITTTGTGVLTLSNNITTDNDQTYTAAGGVLLGANVSLTATVQIFYSLVQQVLLIVMVQLET